MQIIDLPPFAPSLLDSMRFIGYTLEAAVADIIDNSIAAGASKIQVFYDSTDQPRLSILDNGHGMSREELLGAMRHGSRNPAEERDVSDLGRYGLGLKTASLSQCRNLTVVALKDGSMSAFSWDLDKIHQTGKWSLMELEASDLGQAPEIKLLSDQGAGALIIWSKLDRATEGDAIKAQSFDNKMNVVADHLALVFHRYLKDEEKVLNLKIQINSRPVSAFDPFLINSTRTQLLPEDSFFVDGEVIKVKPFILPAVSKMSAKELRLVGGEESLRRGQGFYVYRNKRLIIWGEWFGLARKDELGKLARVRIDVPTKLDRLWTVDVKKSAAFPPEIVRKNLRRTIEIIKKASGNVLTFKGRKLVNSGVNTVWQELEDREGYRYEINREHPLIKGLFDSVSGDNSKNLKSILKIIEKSFPCEILYSRYLNGNKINSFDSDEEFEVEESLSFLLKNWAGDQLSKKTFIENLEIIPPYDSFPNIIKKYKN